MQKKLMEIQATLKAPKGQYNNYGKFHYRSCEDILEAVKPLCVAAGLLLTLSDEVVEVGGRVYIKATALLTEGDKFVKVSAYAREALTKTGMDDAQCSGSSSTYARKYALNGLFLIDDTKDADTRDNASQAPRVTKTAQVSDQFTQASDPIGEDEAKRRTKLREMILKIANEDQDTAKKTLVQFTEFKGRDGNMVPGVDSVHKLKGKRLNVTFQKVKEQYVRDWGDTEEMIDVESDINN